MTYQSNLPDSPCDFSAAPSDLYYALNDFQKVPSNLQEPQKAQRNFLEAPIDSPKPQVTSITP